MEIDREAVEGIFGCFQVTYKSMVYFANFQHILFLSELAKFQHILFLSELANFHHILFFSELTFCTTILVHHVLPYVVVP
jgi:hypothetical protein